MSPLPEYSRRGDVIYGRKFGAALTLDVFTPHENARGVGIVVVISGGWFSSHEHIEYYEEFLIAPLVRRGYTVFAVVPSSQPKFTIPEIVEDVHRAVRFVRTNATEFGIDSSQIGISGASAGGHLSLMIGLTGAAGNSDSEDGIERESSRVQAVAEYYAPTDFLNYGALSAIAFPDGILKGYEAPFDFHEFDVEVGKFMRIENTEKVLEIARQVSPITHVDAQAPPILMVHGDADDLVPLQQSEILLERMQAAGAQVKLVVKANAEHGWENMQDETVLFADWFDLHLAV